MSAIACEHLVELAHQKSTESRKALGATITDLFTDGGSGALTDRERSLMYDILHKVIADVEMSVRKALSESLADVADAPTALITLLANDEIEVAYPVLTRSPVLCDADLIEVVQHRALEHQLAIAMRYTVSEDVSAALVTYGRPSVIETLLHNENARFSQATFAYLVEESRRFDTFHEPLLRRSELSPDLAKRMFLWVSAALREFIIDHFNLDEATVDELLEKAAFRQIDATTAESQGTSSQKLADQLSKSGKITPEMLVNAMAQGEINLFVSMFGRVTGLRRELIMRLLFEAGGEGLAIACKAVDLGRETFCSLLELSRKARPGDASKAAQGSSALALFDATPRDSAIPVLKKWQRNPDYLAAVNDLKRKAGVHG